MQWCHKCWCNYAINLWCHKYNINCMYYVLYTYVLCNIIHQYNCIMYTCCCCCQVASVMSHSVRPHRQQPNRLPRPWDSPGNNPGVGCHFLLQCKKVKNESEVAQSCPTLCDPWTAAHQAPPSMGFSRQVTNLYKGGKIISQATIERQRLETWTVNPDCCKWP